MSQDPKTEEKIVEEKAGEEEKTNADAPGDEIKKSVKRDEVNEGKKSSKTSDV